jgi:molecular chaperone DnaK (HSP70)
MIRLGVDFGTANTVVCYWNETIDSAEVLRIPGLDRERVGATGLSQFVIPSVSAYNKLREEPPRFGAQVPPGADCNPEWQVFRYTKSVAMNRTVNNGVPILGRLIHPKDAAAEFLKNVINNAQLTVLDPDTEFVLTAPIESFDQYRDWLADQVIDPAISSVRVIDEATAAAAGYAHKLGVDEKIMVFDFGAGTLDITIATVDRGEPGTKRNGVRVISKRGAVLGGKDIDSYVMQWCHGKWRIGNGDPQLTKDLNGQLVESCELAKVKLSHDESTTIRAVHPKTGEELVAELGRAEFEDILKNKDVIRKTNMTLQDAIYEARSRGIEPDEIGAVFMVGGTSLIPRIVDIVKDSFPADRVLYDSPLEAVAKGAASIAGGYEATDYIQHEYAIRHFDPSTGTYSYKTIVEQGTQFPTTEPVFKQMVQATHDGQTRLGIQIFEVASKAASESSTGVELQMDADGGLRLVQMSPQKQEERRRSHLNENSPTFLEAHPPAKARENRFRVDFQIDGMRRLTVTAFDVLNNKFVLTNEPVVKLA